MDLGEQTLELSAQKGELLELGADLLELLANEPLQTRTQRGARAPAVAQVHDQGPDLREGQPKELRALDELETSQMTRGVEPIPGSAAQVPATSPALHRSERP